MGSKSPTDMKRVWLLALPIILSNITVPLLGAVDTAVMGHLDSPVYLGAVALGSLIFNYVYWGFGFLRMGTTGLAAQAYGAENFSEVRAILARSTIVALALGLLVWAFQNPIISLLYLAFDASQTVENYAAKYVSIRIWSAPAALITYALIGWFIGLGRMGSVLILQVAMNGLNIILDVYFVLILEWTIEGVALATAISEGFGFCVGIFLAVRILRTMEGFWSARQLRNGEAFRRLAHVNTDLFLRTLLLISAFAWFTAQGARFGDVTLAANAVLLVFLTLASYALDGFAHAAETLVGQSFGKRDKPAFRSAVVASTKLAATVGCLFTLFFIVGGMALVDVLTGLDEVRREASRYIIWAALVPVVGVWAYQLDGIFLGATSTAAMRNTMAISFGIFLIFSLIATEQWGNHGLWLSFVLFFALRGIALGVLMPRLWQKTNDGLHSGGY